MAISKEKPPTNINPREGMTIWIMLYTSLAVKMQWFPLTQYLQSQNRCFSSILDCEIAHHVKQNNVLVPWIKQHKTIVYICCDLLPLAMTWYTSCAAKPFFMQFFFQDMFLILFGSSQLVIITINPWLASPLGGVVPLPNGRTFHGL